MANKIECSGGTCTYGDLCQGDIFIWEGDTYLATEDVDDYNAVDLSNGNMHVLDLDTIVTKLTTPVTITPGA